MFEGASLDEQVKVLERYRNITVTDSLICGRRWLPLTDNKVEGDWVNSYTGKPPPNTFWHDGRFFISTYKLEKVLFILQLSFLNRMQDCRKIALIKTWESGMT